MSTEGKYPEHEKLSKVKEQSQKCGEFLDWLHERYVLGQHHKHVAECYEDDDGEDVNICAMSTSILYVASANTTKLLAEFFEIDEKKLEEEKLAMLAKLRAGQT